MQINNFNTGSCVQYQFNRKDMSENYNQGGGKYPYQDMPLELIGHRFQYLWSQLAAPRAMKRKGGKKI